VSAAPASAGAPAGSGDVPGDAGTGASVAVAVDPFAPRTRAARGGFLAALNPLAKLAAPVPDMILVVFSRGIALPLAIAAFAMVVLLAGTRLPGRAVVALLLGAPAAALLLGVTFGIWVDPATVAGTAEASVALFSVGDWTFTLAAYLVGLATALRIVAILLLSLIAGVTSTGPDLVRAMVQNLRVPYRIGYTALAALRFVPRFGHELEIIRAAHRVRGTDAGRGPIASVRRLIGYAVPLLASAIRHAERVALAMDARAFGAHPTRTERHLSPWRARDTVFVAAFLVVSALIAWWALGWGR
jgi:energy-coupling factor transport system permease protein